MEIWGPLSLIPKGSMLLLYKEQWKVLSSRKGKQPNARGRGVGMDAIYKYLNNCHKEEKLYLVCDDF